MIRPGYKKAGTRLRLPQRIRRAGGPRAVVDLAGQLLTVTVLFISGCASSSHVLERARMAAAEGSYSIAIAGYLSILEESADGRTKVRAELALSEAYTSLGLRAMQKSEFEAAERFLYSANHPRADSLRAECFLATSARQLKNRDLDSALTSIAEALRVFGTGTPRWEALALKSKIQWAARDTLGCLATACDLQSEQPSAVDSEIDATVRTVALHRLRLAEAATKSERYELATQTLDGLDRLPERFRPELETSREVLVLAQAHSLREKKGSAAAIEFLERSQRTGFTTAEIASQLLEMRRSNFLSIGQKALQDGDLDTAEMSFTNLLSLDPEHALAKQSLEEVTRKREAAERRAQAEGRQRELDRLREEYPGWSSRILQGILEKKISMNMTREQVVASWGRPDDVNSTTFQVLGETHQNEQWIYGDIFRDARILYFDDGVLTSWQKW